MQRRANRCGRLSHVVGQFKGVITKYAHEHHIDFGWQPRFHDRIIRNNDEMIEIAKYIGIILHYGFRIVFPLCRGRPLCRAAAMRQPYNAMRQPYRAAALQHAMTGECAATTQPPNFVSSRRFYYEPARIKKEVL